MCLLPLGFGVGIKLVVCVIWDGMCDIGRDGKYGETCEKV